MYSTAGTRMLLAAALGLSLLAPVSAAEITAVSEFIGDHTDTFNHFSNVQAEQVLPVLGGHGTLFNLTDGGAIKVEFSSQFNGDLVRPLSGMMVGQLGIGRWDFNTPATRFGAWFENNGGADDADVSFFDSNNTPLGTVTATIPAAGGVWHWNGWESTTPFARVEVVGNGVFNGFLWYENVRVTDVPGPATGGVLALLIATLVRGRGPRD